MSYYQAYVRLYSNKWRYPGVQGEPCTKNGMIIEMWHCQVLDNVILSGVQGSPGMKMAIPRSTRRTLYEKRYGY